MFATPQRLVQAPLTLERRVTLFGGEAHLTAQLTQCHACHRLIGRGHKEHQDETFRMIHFFSVLILPAQQHICRTGSESSKRALSARPQMLGSPRRHLPHVQPFADLLAGGANAREGVGLADEVGGPLGVD